MKRLLPLALLILPAFAQVDFAPHNMTSDSTPSPYTASASSTFQDACCGPWRAFDGTSTSEWIGSNGGADYLELDLGNGNTGALTSYAILGPATGEAARAPKNFTLQGSANGSSWSTIDTETNQTGWTNNQTRTYTASSSAYRYFKLNITANNGDATYTDVVELYLYGSSTAPKVCVLSTSMKLSASAGQWTGTGCTGSSYVPGNGDTVTIASGVTLIVDQNWIIGASGANNTTPAVTLAGDTSLVEVQAGATMTARGDFLTANTCGLPAAGNLKLDAGSTYSFDSSLASSPTATRYRVGGPGTGGSCPMLLLNGTAAAHVTVTSVLANGALPGQFRTGNNAVGGDPIRYLFIRGTYADFSYIGDAATHGEAFAFLAYPGAAGEINTCQYCTFNHVGPWATGDLSGDETVSFTGTLLWNHNSYANSLGANNIWLNVAALTGGSRNVTNNYFDLNWNSSAASGNCTGEVLHPGVTLTGNVFAGGYCAPTQSSGDTPWSNNLVATGCLNETGFGGSAPSGAYVWCNVDTGNPHVSWPPTWAQTLTNAIFDSPGIAATTGFGKAFHAGGATGVGVSLLNSVLVPNRYGYESLLIADHTPSIPGNVGTYNHNAGVALTGLTVDESGATSATVASYKSNAWAATAYNSAGNGFLIHNDGGTPNVNDFCASATACDYNSQYPLTLSTAPCPTCSGAQNGYLTKMDYSPNYTGAHDLSTANVATFSGPYFADLTRRLATADTLLFHTTASRGTWMASTAYAAGDSALVNHSAAVYHGSPVNYQCIKGHTATTDNQPEEGWYTSANGGVLSFTILTNTATVVFGESPQLSVGNQIKVAASGSVYDQFGVIASVSTTNIANDTVTFPYTLGNGTYTSDGRFGTWMVFWQPNTLPTLAAKLATGATFLDGAVPGCQTTACQPVQYLIDWVLRGYTPQNPALWCAGHDGEAIGAVPFCAAGKVMIGALAGM